MAKKYDFMIILEDDTIQEKIFSHLFKKIIKYQLDKKSAAICGYQLPSIHMKKKESYKFYKIENFIPWGWAVKSDYWKMYRKNILTNNKNEYRNPKSNLIKKIIKKIKIKNHRYGL